MKDIGSGKTSLSSPTALSTLQAARLREGTGQGILSSLPSEPGLPLIPEHEGRMGQGIQWAPREGLVVFEFVYVF